MTSTSQFARRLHKGINKLAGEVDVLLVGEPGTGKRHLAREIHQARSKKGPFMLLDGLSTTHVGIQAVLFGEQRDRARSITGHEPAELVGHATVCIANCDTFASFEQNLLATFLQTEREKYPGVHVILTVSDTSKVSFDVSSFEVVRVPALRDRTGDIPDLAKSILRSLGKESLSIGEDVIRVLEKSSWPGNIHELSSVIGKGAIASRGDALEIPADFLDERQHLQSAIENIAASRAFELDDTLWLIEKLLIQRLLNVTHNNQSKAAEIMGLSEANFRYRLKKFRIRSIRGRK